MIKLILKILSLGFAVAATVMSFVLAYEILKLDYVIVDNNLLTASIFIIAGLIFTEKIFIFIIIEIEKYRHEN